MTAEDIRCFIIDALQMRLENTEINSDTLQGDFDLMASGLIDSMSFLNLVVEIEEWLDIEFNLEELPPEKLTKVGPFCQYLEQQMDGV